MITREYLYRFSYKRPGKARIKVVTVVASDEEDAERKAPCSLPGAWIRQEFLGRVD